jgi:hypothetical protein
MNNVAMDTLSAIPLSDLRDGGPVRYAECNAERVRALRDACLAVFPRAVLPMVPALDLLSRRWLERSRSPYRPEIARIADALGFSGVWLLNASYQWGCTARACDEDGVPWLIRRSIGHSTVSAAMPKWPACAAQPGISSASRGLVMWAH